MTISKVKLFIRKLRKRLSTFEVINILHPYLSLKNVVCIVVVAQILLKCHISTLKILHIIMYSYLIYLSESWSSIKWLFLVVRILSLNLYIVQ